MDIVQQTAFATCDETKSSSCISDYRDSLICPKPRRPGLASSDSLRSLVCRISYQSEVREAKAGTDIIDIIFSKGGSNGLDQSLNQAASSPPIFSGSPPSRATNPLVHDSRFGEERINPLSPLSIPNGLPTSPSSGWKGCGRTKSGHEPATVRIEGFSLNRDSRGCSITAVA